MTLDSRLLEWGIAMPSARSAAVLHWLDCAIVETLALADPLPTLDHDDSLVSVAPYGPDTVP